MPLVDALTLGFTAPLMVTALSVPELVALVLPGQGTWQAPALPASFEYMALIGGAVSGK